jgi:hypothetical protein
MAVEGSLLNRDFIKHQAQHFAHSYMQESLSTRGRLLLTDAEARSYMLNIHATMQPQLVQLRWLVHTQEGNLRSRAEASYGGTSLKEVIWR